VSRIGLSFKVRGERAKGERKRNRRETKREARKGTERDREGKGGTEWRNGNWIRHEKMRNSRKQAVPIHANDR
jgi:hypothetical protein